MKEHGNELHSTLNKMLAGINTAQLGTITEIENNRATVKLSNKRNFGGNVQEQALLLEVPIIISSVGGFAISLPIKKYLPVPCLVIFCQRSIHQRMTKGGEQHPQDDRMHDLADAVCMPCLDWVDIDLNAENFEIKSRKSGSKIEMSEEGRFRITNGTDDLFGILNEALEALGRTKSIVSRGSSSGQWDIDTQPVFSSLAQKVKGMML